MKKIITSVSILLATLFISCSTTEEVVKETPPEPKKPVDNRNYIEHDDDKELLEHGDTKRR